MARGYEPIPNDDITDLSTVSIESENNTTNNQQSNNTVQTQQSQPHVVQVTQSTATDTIGDFIGTFTDSVARIVSNTSQSIDHTHSSSNTNNTNTNNIMIDNISAQLNNTDTQSLFNKLKSRDWKSTLRSPRVFLNPSCFSKPMTSADATNRLETNLAYYFTNYTIFIILLTIMSILSDPYIIILGIVLIGAWSIVLKRDTITIGQHQLTGRSKLIALSTVSAVLIFIFAGSVIFSIIGVSAVVICVHAILNDRGGASITDESNDLELSQV